MKNRKNIAITITSLECGGAEKQCLLLAKALKPYHDVSIIVVYSYSIYPRYLNIIKKEDLEVIFLSKNRIKRAFELIECLKKRNIDIIFSFLPADTVWAAICGRIAGVPYIFGGIRNSFLPKIKLKVLRTVHNRLLNYTIANNYSAYNSSIEFGFKKRVLVVYNGIEIRPISPNLKIDKKTISIITLGRLVKQKDYETAIKAIVELKKMLKNGHRIAYKIVGDGPEKLGIKADIEKYGLEKEVKIITDPRNIYGLLESADIYLCSSIFEGISNSIMEAMNCALPIVATDAGDNRYLVINGKNGFIAPINDFRKLADYMCQLIESPYLRCQMGLESYNHLVKNFSYETFQNKYLNLIENVSNLQILEGEVR